MTKPAATRCCDRFGQGAVRPDTSPAAAAFAAGVADDGSSQQAVPGGELDTTTADHHAAQVNVLRQQFMAARDGAASELAGENDGLGEGYNASGGETVGVAGGQGLERGSGASETGLGT